MFSTFEIQLKVRVQECVQRSLDSRLIAHFGLILVQCGHAPTTGDRSSTSKDGFEKILFVLKVVMNERRMDSDATRYITQSDAVQTILGKQILRSIQNLLDAFRALLGFTAPGPFF